MRQAQIGAIFFALWGLLHIVGGIAILAVLGDGPAAGFAVYANAAGVYPDAAGAILAMNSFAIALIGAAVVAIAATLNWRNDALGAALNILLAGGMDVALAVFLLGPGHVSLTEALVGFGLFACGAFVSVLALFAKKSAHDKPSALPAQS